MESTKINTSPVEEDATLSKFRRRKKILIITFLTIFISLSLIIAALITHLIRDDDQTSSQSDDQSSLILHNPAIQTYYTSACYSTLCRNILNPLISSESISNPNQIFTTILQTASVQLQNLTFLMNSRDNNTFNICSRFIGQSKSRIDDTLAIMRVSPFVESQSDEQRSEMRIWIMKVEENLDSCIDDLEKKVESTAAIEVRAKAIEVRVYVRSGSAFLLSYKEIMQEFSSNSYGGLDLIPFFRGMDFEFVFGMCLCGLQLSFIFSVIRSLCRNP